MLYLRRKAEIEVLSSAVKGTGDRVASSQDPEILHLDDCRSEMESPLVRYLAVKISKAVKDNARKFVSTEEEDGIRYGSRCED